MLHPTPSFPVILRLAIIAVVGGIFLSAQADTEQSGSAESTARAAAAPYVKSQGLRLRQDFWQGALSGTKGKAIRLQFFKGHSYRLFLATNAAEKAAGTRLHVMVVDKSGNVLGESALVGPASSVEVKPKKTGAYMILLRAEATTGNKNRKIPAVLFYGYH